MTTIFNFLMAVGILAIAAIVARWQPFLGGIIVMIPTKTIGYLLITNMNQESIRGMLLGTLLVTVPFLIFIYVVFGRN